MRILALVPGGIGDQILFFPTLEDIKRQYPQAVIDVIAEPRARSAYRVCQFVREVFSFDYQARNGLADYLNLLGIIRDREYDVALTVGQGWTVGLLLWLNGIPKRIGYSEGSSLFLSDSVPQKTEQYLAHQYHDLVQGLGIHTPCPNLSVNVPKSDIKWAEAEQKRLGLQEGYILIHGESGNFTPKQQIEKVYPVQQWQQIIQDIQHKQPNLPLVLLKDSEDDEWVNLILQACQNLKVVAPPDTGKLAAIIAGANLMLCTDSAPLYLSVAVETYTIALFGPTEAAKRLPSDNKNCIGIQSPTGALADISPESVLAQIWRE